MSAGPVGSRLGGIGQNSIELDVLPLVREQLETIVSYYQRVTSGRLLSFRIVNTCYRPAHNSQRPTFGKIINTRAPVVTLRAHSRCLILNDAKTYCTVSLAVERTSSGLFVVRDVTPE